MKFLDSNILAYAFYDNPYTAKCQKAIREGGLTDTFNLVEAFFIIEKETSREIAQKSIKGILRSSIRIADVNVNLVFEALKKANNHKLSIFDLMHYSCALLNNCSAFVTYDRDFDNLGIPREEP